MVVFVLASAALGRRGSTLAVVTAGLSAVALGTAAVVFPAAASSVGSLWGAVAVIWGAGVLVLVGRRPGATRVKDIGSVVPKETS
jgi:hypothetical protein